MDTNNNQCNALQCTTMLSMPSILNTTWNFNEFTNGAQLGPQAAILQEYRQWGRVVVVGSSIWASPIIMAPSSGAAWLLLASYSVGEGESACDRFIDPQCHICYKLGKHCITVLLWMFLLQSFQSSNTNPILPSNLKLPLRIFKNIDI